MSSTVLGMALATAAAVALNGSYLMQHAGSAGGPAVEPRRPVATVVTLLRSPLWSLGVLVGLTGWALHVAAMREAPLSLVQAFAAGGLALAAPVAAVSLRQRLTRADAGALAVLVVALALLASGLHDAGRHARFAPAALAAWVGGLAAVAAAVLRCARRRRRAAALGLAGGLLYGAADLALKALTGLSGPMAMLLSPWPAVAAATTAGAFFAFQRGLQHKGPLQVVAAMTAGTNLSSIAGAVAIFGDPLGRTPALAALHVLAFALVVAATWRLAPAEALLAGLPSPPASRAGYGAAMEIVGVALRAPAARLDALATFYGDRLGLEVTRTADGAAVRVGSAGLELTPAGDGSAPFYHVALLVPGDRFAAAREWIAARVELLPDPRTGEVTFPFDAWDARACYFHDPAGNIVELIAHRGVAEDAGDPVARRDGGTFSGAELAGISEVGLVGDPVAGMAAELARLGVEVWDGSVEGGLAFAGRRAHTLVLARRGRGWLPTGRPAEVHPVELTLRGAARGEAVLGGLPYRVRGG